MSFSWVHVVMVCICLALQCETGYSQNEEKIFWTDSLELDWEMFKVKGSGYSYMKAMTHSGIMYEVEVKNGQVEIDVKSYFIYGKSWVMKGYKKPELLAHEQIHFHIAEIYKRKLDTLCEKYRVDHRTFVSKGYQRKLQRDFDLCFTQMDEYQKLYDKETNHGTLTAKQLEWEKKIKKELGL